eukprot:PhM_4_TR17809/c0_g2_i1/m.60151
MENTRLCPELVGALRHNFFSDEDDFSSKNVLNCKKFEFGVASSSDVRYADSLLVFVSSLSVMVWCPISNMSTHAFSTSAIKSVKLSTKGPGDNRWCHVQYLDGEKLCHVDFVSRGESSVNNLGDFVDALHCH